MAPKASAKNSKKASGKSAAKSTGKVAKKAAPKAALKAKPAAKTSLKATAKKGLKASLTKVTAAIKGVVGKGKTAEPVKTLVGKAAAPAALPATGKGKKANRGAPPTSILPSGLSKRGGGTVKVRSDMISEAVCREVACEGLSTTGGYCRLHYIKNWKKIKRKEIILREGKLNQYIEELVAKYPDKYIEAIRHDLTHDREFAKVITDLDLDETSDEFENDQESVEGLVDNIKREFDDDGDAF